MSDCKPCQTKKCKPNQCGCAVLISSDCVNDVKSVFTNLDIPTGLPLTQTLELIDEAFGAGNNIVNVGTGAGIYKGNALNGDKQLKSITVDPSITITNNANSINLGVNNPQKEITLSPDQTYTLQDVDFMHTIYVICENELGDPNQEYNIEIPNNLRAGFTAGFIIVNESPEEGIINVTSSTQTVVTPTGYEAKITGTGNWFNIERRLNTAEFNLLGNLIPN
jgi:hypothetical protein